MYIDNINELLYQQIEVLAKTRKREVLEEEVEKAKAMALLASQYIAGETLQMRKDMALKSVSKKQIAGYIE